MRACASSLLVGCLVLAACGGGRGDGRNGRQDEAYIDPGPSEIAQTLASEYATPDSASVPGTLRGMAVWRDRDDGEWVYVERTSGGGPPERTVYQVDHAAGRGYRAEVYALPDGAPGLPADVGRAAPDPLAEVAVDALRRHEGCALVFDRTGPGDYVGETKGTACPPRSPGAAYSVTTIDMDGPLSVWTRDLDAEGTPVAGPSAPTVYVRVSEAR